MHGLALQVLLALAVYALMSKQLLAWMPTRAEASGQGSSSAQTP